MATAGMATAHAQVNQKPAAKDSIEKPTVTVKDSASVSSKGQPKMTLQECIATALQNNLTIRRAAYNIESYKVTKLTSWGAFLPTLNTSLTYGRNYGRSINPVTNAFYNGVVKSYNPSLQAQLTLFNGFRLHYNYLASKKNIEAADLDFEKAKNDVIINVAGYYVTVILNRELYENAKVQLLSSQQQLGRIKLQVEAGALPKSNELNQEAIVATNETNMINQENTLNISLLQLKQAMQVPASTPLDVVIPDLSVEEMVIDQTPEEIYAVSAKTLPQIKSALLKVESAELAYKAARGSYLPRLTIGGSMTTNYSSASDYIPIIVPTGYGVATTPVAQVGPSDSGVPTTDPTQLIYSIQPTGYTQTGTERYNVHDQFKNNLYKSVGVTLSVPIMNGFNTRAGVRNAEINREVARLTVTDNENQLRQSIETAYNNALAAAKTYAASVKQVQYSEEAYRMTKIRLDNGAANFVEYQISANDLFSARSNLARSKYNFILTKKIIDFYQGKPIDY